MAGAGGAGGEGGSPGPISPIAFTTTIDSDWQTGYQATVNVTNIGMEKITWSISFKVEGTIANIWNATQTTSNGVTTFKGADWNGTLDPGGTASFGFVANR